MTTDNQRVHYERIHDRYQKHYYDKYSNYYRSKLYLNKLSREFQGKKNILEVGCGGGSNLNTYLKHGMINGDYLGIDISPSAVETFQLLSPDTEKYKSLVADFTKEDLELSGEFDLILFVGVLHHMTNNLDQVFCNIERLLSNNGTVIFLEPNAHFLDAVRRIWYKFSDDFDHSNERALTSSEIESLATQHNLELKRGWYSGNIGYFVILQSMIVRTPQWLKFILYKPLTIFDLFIEAIQSRFHLAALIRVYQKAET